MTAGARRIRPGLLAVAVGAGVIVAVLAVLLQTPDQRLLAVVLAAGAFAAGVGACLLLPPRRPSRTVMERLNDVAFLTVLAAASLLLVGVARPFGVLAPALVGGLLAGIPLRAEQAPGRPQP